VLVVVIVVSVSVEVVVTTASCAPPSSSLSESDLKESSIFIPRGDFFNRLADENKAWELPQK